MHLLNTTTYELKPFIANPPRYAILSHTWDRDEVLFSHAARGYKAWKRHSGALKVTGSCRVAKAKGYDFIWIDTCCINKDSSAELSEAINSMFAWYRDADFCLAYLTDVFDTNIDQGDIRWFTRGWTLQELVAPRSIKFYNATWRYIGSRRRLSRRIAGRTGIERDILYKPGDLRQFSVYDRMCWASKRHTTRPEDGAYCLLGLFQVNMPLLYGEGGARAFRRLQEEIMKTSNDQSLFFHWERFLFATRPGAFSQRIRVRYSSLNSKNRNRLWAIKGGVRINMIVAHSANNPNSEDICFGLLDGVVTDNSGVDVGLRPAIKLEKDIAKGSFRVIGGNGRASICVFHYGGGGTCYEVDTHDFRKKDLGFVSNISKQRYVYQLNSSDARRGNFEIGGEAMDLVAKPQPSSTLFRIHLDASSGLSLGRRNPSVCHGLFSFSSNSPKLCHMKNQEFVAHGIAELRLFDRTSAALALQVQSGRVNVYIAATNALDGSLKGASRSSGTLRTWAERLDGRYAHASFDTYLGFSSGRKILYLGECPFQMQLHESNVWDEPVYVLEIDRVPEEVTKLESKDAHTAID